MSAGFALLMTFTTAAGTPVTPLFPEEPLTLALDGIAPQVLSIDTNGGETVTITARALDTVAVDTTLELLSPRGRRVAFNDNHRLTDAPTLSPTDSALVRVTLHESGRYTLRIDSFNGVSIGEVEITLTHTVPVPSEALTESETLTRRVVRLPRARVYTMPLTLNAGNVLSVTAQDADGRLDSVLALYSADGIQIAFNDDHASTDLTLNVLDARLDRVVIPQDGVYTLALREFLARAGAITLTVVIE